MAEPDLSRIKGNIEIMISKGAPEADIDQYLFSEKVTPEQLRASAPTTDPYRATAEKEYAEAKAKGVPVEQGAARRFLQGASFNTADEILAGLTTPFEMVKRGTFNPVEGYRHAKAAEDVTLDEARKESGLAGAGMEILGGVGTGVGLAKAGLTAGRGLAPGAGLLARSAASAIDGLGMGALAGAMEGNSLEERGSNALTGGLIGGGLGGVTPGVLAIGGTALSPIFSNIRARVNPEGFAQSQVARAATESGKTPTQLAQAVADSDAAGQGSFTLADAMGNSGQRMLSTVARSPGEGRTAVVDFLNTRQAGQGGRVSQIVDDALGAGGTARKTADDLTQIARNESAPFYEKALDQKPVWNERIQQFFDDPITQRGLKEGMEVQRLESLAAGKKFDPKDYAITGVNEAGDPIISGVPNMRTINLIKKGWDNVLESYRDGTTGRLMLDEKGRAIDAVRRSFLKEIDAVNPDYAKARELYAGPAQARSAIDRGGQAVTRGRAADNVREFEALTEPNKHGYRTGYADKVSENVERGAEGVNKARPLTSEKRQAELGAMSLHQGPVQPGKLDPLQQRLARENTMFETRNTALGGSKTADNLADNAAMGVDPSMVMNVLSGNWHGALRSAMAAGGNAITGNTAAVRAEVAKLLLSSGKNVNPASIQKVLDQTIERMQLVQTVARQLGRGASGGLAVAPAALAYDRN